MTSSPISFTTRPRLDVTMSYADPSKASTIECSSRTGNRCERGVNPTRSTNPTATYTVIFEVASARAAVFRRMASSMCARNSVSR